MEARKHGEGDDGVKHGVPGGADPGLLIDEAKQHDADGENLAETVGLTEQRGVEVAQVDDRIEDDGGEQHADVAAEDEDGNTRLQDAHVGEGKEEGTEQELVGDGVEILADAGALTEPAGEQAVHGVSKCGHEEEHKSGDETALEHREDQQGGKADAEQREQVRRGAEPVRSTHAGTRLHGVQIQASNIWARAHHQAC